ncbi:hypothetical protein [Roseomonas sp. BN140053]|uniref:hypothetical protein n=1 Tax=Roseomonas sp. BN140053 TaxID=3391898 RepID=UPI0039EC15FA
MGQIEVRQMVKNTPRPPWAGVVTISDNKPFGTNDWHTIESNVPRSVYGIIVPVTTKGRPGAPKPLNEHPTGKAYGTDKGHLLGLDLGGPDISANIAPQSNLWQQSGGWRAIETNAGDIAKHWMGITDTYDPAGPIPAPACAAFFRVGPYPEKDPRTGEPLKYTGSVTKIELDGRNNGGYRPHRDQETYIFLISPKEVWWERGRLIGA